MKAFLGCLSILLFLSLGAVMADYGFPRLHPQASLIDNTGGWASYHIPRRLRHGEWLDGSTCISDQSIGHLRCST